jgi:outer membrane receptor protein involved in Fe transport
MYSNHRAMMRFFTPAFLLFFITGFSLAQIPQGRPGGTGNFQQMNIGRFYGKVVDDATGKGIGYASVQLYGMKWDSTSKKMENTLLAGQLTLENGDFSLENLPVMGEFTLKINFLGYALSETKVSFNLQGAGRPNGAGRPGGGGMPQAGAVDKDLGNIKLSASSNLLKEVTIEAQGGQVSLALDKKIYKVDKDNVAAGGTAEDALKNVPTLNVDIDGNLTMRNSAPQLFVDGRPTNMTLDQIPADAIDNVEVISNPSAKYDASGGGAGIVNIVLKKDRHVGYNGSVRTGIDMRGRGNLGGDLNARQNKFNAFVGLNLNQRRNITVSSTERQNFNFAKIATSDVSQSNRPVSDGFFGMVRGGVDWFISNRNTLTVSANYNKGSHSSSDLLDWLENFYFDTLPDYSIQSLRYSDSKRSYANLGSQLLFKHLFPKEGKELTADINYNSSESNNTGTFRTEYLNSPAPNLERQTGSGGNQFLTFQTDFVNPITKTQKIELGARAAIRNFNSSNGNYYFDRFTNTYVYVPGFSDNYEFKDQVFAAYSTYSQSFQKWGYQLGLRAESSKYTGTLIDRDTAFTNNFPLSLFPSLFTTYKLNEEDNLQFNFTRRINRPNFFQLIPFTDFSDSLNLSRGNPDLIPEFAHSLEFSYQNIINKQHNFLLSVYYKRSDNLITRYFYSQVDPVTLRTIGISTFENANSSTATGVEFTLKNNFWKILELTTNINMYNSVLNLSSTEQTLNAEQFTWLVKENINIRLPKSFTVQLNGSYQSRTAFDTGGGGGGGRWGGGASSTAQGYSIPVWYVDASVRKDLWNRKGSITISIQDIFRSRRNGSHTESVLFIQDSWRRRDAQLVRMNFSYRFGKFDVSLFKRKNTRMEGEGMEGF